MNKIFKVVWSKVRNAYVVVSEIAKNTVSGVGKRNRVKRFSMGATLAAVALTSSFFASNCAEAVEIVDANRTLYAAIGKATKSTNPFEGLSDVTLVSHDKTNGVITIRLPEVDGKERQYTYRYVSLGDKDEDKFWVRDGFGVKKLTHSYHPEAGDLKVDLYSTTALADYSDIVAAGQHTAVITNERTAINNVSLDKMAYVSYAAITNSGQVGTPRYYGYYIKQGEHYVNVGGNGWLVSSGNNFYKSFYEFKTDNNGDYLSTEYNETTGKFIFDGNEVEFEDIYNIDGKIGVFLTKSVNDGVMTSANLADLGAEVYGGSVYGKNNEVLISGYNKVTKNWSTVWGAEVTDPNATIESMTLSEFNEILHHLHEEDVKLADADIVTTKVTSGKTNGISSTDNADITNGGSINLINKIGNQVPGIVVQSVENTGADTQIIISDSGTDLDGDGNSDTGSITLNAGSRVSVTKESDTLTKITVNGETTEIVDKYLSSTKVFDDRQHGNGVYVSLQKTDTTSNKIYFDTGGGTVNNNVAEDTYVTIKGDGNYNVAKLNTGSVVRANNDVDSNAVDGGALEQLSVNGKVYNVATSESVAAAKTVVEAGNVNINNSNNSTLKNVDVTQNAGTNQNAVYTISVADMRVKSGEANYSTGKINLTNGDGTTAEITGLHDYYVTSGNVSYAANGDDVTLTLTREGVAGDVEVTGLKNTYTTGVSVTGGSNNANISFNRNDGDGKYRIALLGSDSVKIVTDESGIHFSATDTYVTGGNAHYDANGTGTATLVTNKDNTTATITGLQNTFINDVSLSGNELTFNYNNGSTPETVDLSTLVNSLGTMNHWHAKVGDISFEVNDNDTVEFAAGPNINVLLNDAKDKITIETKNEVAFASVAVGGSSDSSQVLIDNNGIHMGNQNITGLAPGVHEADAVNLKQLNDSRTTVVAGTNVTSIGVSPGSNGGTTYTINAKDTTYSASMVGKEDGGLQAGQVTKYTITNDVTNGELVTIIDTDTDTNTVTRLVSGSSNVEVSKTGETEGEVTYTVTATDTTLKNDVATYDANTKEFIIEDTSHNTTKLKNVALASDLQTVVQSVQQNTTSITNITTGNWVKLAVDDGESAITLHTNNSGSPTSRIEVSSAKGTGGKDATLTFKNLEDEFYVEVGSTVEVDYDTDGNGHKIMNAIHVNDDHFIVKDTKLDEVNSVSTPIEINGVVVGNDYVVADTAENTVEISDVASASVLSNVIGNVTANTNNITSILDGTLSSGNLFKITTNASGKINLVNTHTGNVASSIGVARTGGNSGNDVQVTFGTGNDSFSVTTGSLVNATGVDNNILTQLTINGHAYDLVHAEEVAYLNNLSVSGGEGRVAYKTKPANEFEKHGWEIIDQTQKDANNNITIYRDTTLDSNAVKGTIASGYNYTIYDTAGNSVVLEDVASANKLQTVSNKVDVNASNIEALDARVDTNTTNITNIMDGKVVKLGVDRTNSEIVLTPSSNNSSRVKVTAKEGEHGQDATLTFSSGANNQFDVKVGSTVKVKHPVNSNDANGIVVNGVEYDIVDTKLRNDVADRAISDDLITNTYTIWDSAGHYTQLKDVASAKKLETVVENVQTNTNNITSILGGSLVKIGAVTSNNKGKIALFTNNGITSDINVISKVGEDGKDATLTFNSTEGQFSVNVGSTVSVDHHDTINNEDVMHGITVNGQYFVVEDTQLSPIASREAIVELTNSAGVVYGRDYAVLDSSGKRVDIKDVASAKYVDTSVKNINQNITNLSERIDSEAAKDVVVTNTDHNIYVNSSTNEEGDITYALSLAANVNVAQSIKVGDNIVLHSDVGRVEANALIAHNRIEVGGVLIAPSTITGLANRTWDSTNIVSGRAATEDQLQAAVKGVTTNVTNNYNALHNDDIKEIFVNPDNGTVALNRYSMVEVPGTLQFSSGGGHRDTTGGTVAYPDTYITISNSSGEIKLNTGSKVIGNVGLTTGATEQLTSLQINGKDYIIPAWDIDKDGKPVFQDYHLHNEDERLGVYSTNENKFVEEVGTELVGYKVDDSTGVVQLHVLDRHNEEKRVGIVNIGNIASKSSVDALTDRVVEVEGDIVEIKGDINNINAKIDGVSNASIKSGSINSDGTITLLKNTDKEDNKIILDGKLENHALETHADKTEAYKADSDGVVTLVSKDKYSNPNSRSASEYHTYIADVASKEKLDDLSGAVGVDDKNALKEKYKETTFLKESENLADADVKLDAAIKANAERDYNNDVILQEQIQNQSQHLDSRINQLGSKVNKVGAGAAALAALHPMDFDPDDKLSFAVGAGNYAGETATALGAFYRPNEKVMMNVAGTYGNGENMVNMGVSFALDRTNHVSNSRTAMAKEIVDLREQVATQGQQIAQLVALVQQLAGVQQPVVPAEQLFPDVPENHWAYEYVNTLVSKGIIEGYPDGTFGGDRTMTRYEFAAMLFRAMEQGVVLSEQIRQEFEKELGRVRVDRVKGADNDPNKIERVRVNKAAGRDNYGSKIVQVKH